MVPYRVLVVDDSAFMRKIVSDLILQDPQFMIVATAKNGLEAIEAVKTYKPDAVTLDLEMPEMNGLEALHQIMKTHPTPVIMLSGISEDHTRETIKALQFGAFDFIHKPSSALSNDIHQVGEQLLEKLHIAVLTQRHRLRATVIERKVIVAPEQKQRVDLPSMSNSHLSQQSMKRTNTERRGNESKTVDPLQKSTNKQAFKAAVSNKKETTAASAPPEVLLKPLVMSKRSTPPEQNASSRKATSFQHLVAIGTSTGGPRALHEVIGSLPGNLPAPVLVVQHMPPKFTKSLAQRLDSFSELRVVEASQGEKLEAGVVYIAPGGYHMELAKTTEGYVIALTHQPLRNGHRPSVDILFESLTPFPELRRHAVIMTGMGSDGARSLKQLVESGGETVIAEAEESCIVFGMPRAAIEGGFVNEVVPLQQIAAQVVNAVMK